MTRRPPRPRRTEAAERTGSSRNASGSTADAAPDAAPDEARSSRPRAPGAGASTADDAPSAASSPRSSSPSSPPSPKASPPSTASRASPPADAASPSASKGTPSRGRLPVVGQKVDKYFGEKLPPACARLGCYLTDDGKRYYCVNAACQKHKKRETKHSRRGRPDRSAFVYFRCPRCEGRNVDMHLFSNQYSCRACKHVWDR